MFDKLAENRIVKHVVVATGVALATALALCPKSGPIPWRSEIIDAGQAWLAAMGIARAWNRTAAK